MRWDPLECEGRRRRHAPDPTAGAAFAWRDPATCGEAPVPIRAKHGRKGAQHAQSAAGDAQHDGVAAQLKHKIDKAKSIDAVTDVMLHSDTQKSLASLPQGVRDEIRDYAKARLVALGWPSKKAA